MEISSIIQSAIVNQYSNAQEKNNEPKAQDSTYGSAYDTLELSDGTQVIPPPPHEMDFANMTDDELKDYLQQMYELTGIIPGKDDGDVQSLTGDELIQIREILLDMAANNPVTEQMQSEETSKITGEDMKTLMLMFMLSLQSSMSEANSSSSNEMDYMIFMLQNSLISKFSSESSNDQLQEQQAIAAYEQNAMML